MSVVVDINILVYSLNLASKYHSVCREYLLDNQNDIFIANQTLFEFIRVVTHPQNKQRISLPEAISYAEKYQSLYQLIYETKKDMETFKFLSEKYRLGSNRVFDTKLVSTILGNGIKQIATINDRDFVVFLEIKVINPAK